MFKLYIHIFCLFLKLSSVLVKKKRKNIVVYSYNKLSSVKKERCHDIWYT